MLNRVRLRWFGWLALVALGACGPHVEGHAVATHTAADAPHVDASAVRVSSLVVPEGASELGIVQAHVIEGSITDAMPEFRAQVAQLGGDFGKINDVSTTFEMQTRTRSETYNCGTSDKPSTCTRMVTETVELATTRIIGKAYRLGAPKPKDAAPSEPPPEPDLESPAADEPAGATPTNAPAPPPGPEGATTTP